MKAPMKLFSYLLILVPLCIGCSNHTRKIGDYNLISTKNINLETGVLVQREKVVHNEEFDSSKDIVYFADAVSHAIEKNPCSVALSDARVFFNWSTFGRFSQNKGYTVEGIQVIDTTKPGCEDK